MKIDFHTHGKLSKKVEFSLDYFIEMAESAKESGLDAIALTEHFNTRRFSDVYDTLDREFPYVDNYYDVNGLKVFPGMEVDIQETGHILFIGKREEIRSLRAVLEPFTEKGGFIPFETLLNEASVYPFLIIGAHPFRESTPLYQLNKDLLSRLDAFDLNGKDLFVQGIRSNTEKVAAFAEEIDIPVVGGSDTHQSLQYGVVVNELGARCDTVAELKKAIADCNYKLYVSPYLYAKVDAAQKKKEQLKAQMKMAEGQVVSAAK